MSQANTIITNGVHKLPRLHCVEIDVALTTDTYATPTGVTVDVSTQLTLLGLDWNDVHSAIGFSSAGQSVYATKTSTTGQFTVRLWNGESETADGAKTLTLKLYLLIDLGSRSYNT